MHHIIETEDGSNTLYVPELHEHYHSVHGAVQESMHIFIQAGVAFFTEMTAGRFTASSPLYILEAGFGTGLNAYLTCIHATQMKLPIEFHTLEKYPLTSEETEKLNYTATASNEERKYFQELHACPWEEIHHINPYFKICKHLTDLRNICFENQFHIIFFDAFNPDVQPHLWNVDTLTRYYNALQPGGILVTYCVKGCVKRALREIGFTLERLPGPPGKREMLRATKTAMP